MVLINQGSEEPPIVVKNFKECVAQGYPVLLSYPRQCKTPDGKTFIEDSGNELEKQNLIRVNNPRPNEIIQSPLQIQGEARGFWFFEASFPVRLLDENRKEIAEGIAQAQGEWMTEDFVPFEARVEFQQPATENGILILEKDNPSGLPENADELRIPVRFDLSQKNQKQSGVCLKTGCSGQVCADKEVVTTCEFLPEYACYKDAICERQADGNCAWTETEELIKCLE